MPCNFKVKVKVRGYYVPVACGRCMYCRIQKSQHWAIRISHEMQTNNNKGIFLTLTYNDENVPEGGTLVKSDFQKYIKRIRKAGLKFKYYGVGEYGGETHRPHYHAILIGVDYANPLTHQVLTAKWDLGFIKIGDVKNASIYYVTNYVVNKWISDDKDYYKDIGEPFQVNSQGLGKGFVFDGKLNIDKQRGMMYYKGKKVPVLPYYKKKVEGIKSGGIPAMVAADLAYLDSEEVSKYGVQAIGEQFERNKKAKFALKKKKI